MAVTATYDQITSATNTWVGTFKMGGIYYAINSSGTLYSVSGGVATSLRTVNGDVWGAVRCDGTYIYRASGTQVLKIDPLTGNVPASSALSGVRSIALDAAGARIFALLNSGALYVFTTNNLTQYYVNNLGAATYGPGLCYLNGALYIPVYGGKIKKYVVDTGVLTTLNNSLSASWLCMDTDGTYLYATVDGGRIYKIDPTDATTYEEVQGDSTGRWWYSCFFDSASPSGIWANAYNGYCYNIQLGPAIPTASVSSSTIYADTSVTLSCSTAGAVIKYTTDGTTPGLSNGTTYSGAFTITKTTTIKFCAIYNGYVTAGTDIVLTSAGIFTQLASITGSSYQWMCIGYYNNMLYGVLIDNATTPTISPTLYSINPTTGALTSLATLTFTPYSMTIGGDKIYLSNITGRNVREYSLTGTLTNTYVCGGDVTPFASITGIVYIGGKVYALSGNGQPRTYFYEITPGNTTVAEISFSGSYSPSCSTNAWTDGTYIYYGASNNVYKVNPSTGVTVIAGTVSNTNVSNYNTYVNGSSIMAYPAYSLVGVLNPNESYSYLYTYPNPNSIAISYLTTDGTFIYGTSGTGTAKIYKMRATIDTGTPSIYKSGSWKSENALYVRHSSSWQLATKAFKVSNGLWTRIY